MGSQIQCQSGPRWKINLDQKQLKRSHPKRPITFPFDFLWQCGKCEPGRGRILPLNPLDPNSGWSCHDVHKNSTSLSARSTQQLQLDLQRDMYKNGLEISSMHQVWSLLQLFFTFLDWRNHIMHTKNKGRNAYKGFLPFFEKPGAITTTPLKEKKTTPLVKLHLPFHTFNIWTHYLSIFLNKKIESK